MARLLSVIPKRVPPRAVQVELSLEEAQTLDAVLSNIAGSPNSSRRKYCDSVLRMLQDADLPSSEHNDSTGSIAFRTSYESGR